MTHLKSPVSKELKRLGFRRREFLASEFIYPAEGLSPSHSEPQLPTLIFLVPVYKAHLCPQLTSLTSPPLMQLNHAGLLSVP